MVEFIGFVVVVGILAMFGILYSAIAVAILWVLWKAKWVLLIIWIFYYFMFLPLS